MNHGGGHKKLEKSPIWEDSRSDNFKNLVHCKFELIDPSFHASVILMYK